MKTKGYLGVLAVFVFLLLSFFSSTALGGVTAGSVAEIKQCIKFEVLDLDSLTRLPPGYQLTSVPNVILNVHNEIVLTDRTLTQTQNFTHIQGVSGSFYGEPICVTIFDCGAAGAGSTSVEVVNRQRNVVTTFEIEEICSNDGVFFGCVETAYVPFNDTNAPDPTTIVSGEFGDELVVRYTSSQPIDEVGHQQYEMSVWLTCKEHQYWDFETISDVMLRDSINRNIRKLEDLREKILLLQDILFGGSRSCEDIAMVTNLAPTAMNSFEFLECVTERSADAEDFLGNITQSS